MRKLQRNFGQTVKGYRKTQGVSQKDLANRAGISVTYLCTLEISENPNPSLHVIRAIAEALGVEAKNLI